MRLCVLSDTHIPDRYDKLPDALVKEIKNADLVIHAGDFTSIKVYQEIKALNSNFKAVLGNMDSPELQPVLKQKETFTVQKRKIGLTHGIGRPDNLLETVRKSFDDTYDLVIFGHSHNALNEKIGKTIFLNPGSPTDKIFATINSYAIIDLDKTININIVRVF